ncbi:MAG: hypothetical protein ACREHE_05995 [Rhizomicrobium sp.]
MEGEQTSIGSIGRPARLQWRSFGQWFGLCFGLALVYFLAAGYVGISLHQTGRLLIRVPNFITVAAPPLFVIPPFIASLLLAVKFNLGDRTLWTWAILYFAASLANWLGLFVAILMQ